MVINKFALIWGGKAGAVFYLDTVCINHPAGRKQYSSGKNTGSSNLEMFFFLHSSSLMLFYTQYVLISWLNTSTESIWVCFKYDFIAVYFLFSFIFNGLFQLKFGRTGLLE